AEPALRHRWGYLKTLTAFNEQFAPDAIRSMYREHKQIEQTIADYEEKLPTVMVMEEMPEPRETHILRRGQYDKPGDRVGPNVPAELPRLTSVSSDISHSALRTPHSANRLDLGRWLVAPENPL